MIDNTKPAEISSLIFDIGNVLCTWSTNRMKDAIDSKIFHRMINTQIWCEYEKGKLSDKQAYDGLAKLFNVDAKDVETAVDNAVQTLSIRGEMFQMIRALKPGRKIYVMSNMPVSSWNSVKLLGGKEWDIFDDIFISGIVGHRKPEMAFFHHILRETGANPENTVFIDDMKENLVAAHFVGIHTILYDSYFNVERLLHNKCEDPVARAQAFLVKNAKKHHSYASGKGQAVYENFSQLLLLEITHNPSLVHLVDHESEWNYFQGSGQFTDEDFPNDLDTTSIALTVVPNIDSAISHKVMDRMLDFLDEEGVPMVYFDRNRPRRDHVVCANVVAFFFANGRGQELSTAVDFLCSLLHSGAYLEGSRYYNAPEIFLYFMLRLIEKAPSLKHRVEILLKQRCHERIGRSSDAVSLAMQLHCCTRLDIDDKLDFERLLDMQQLDGSWEGGSIYGYGLIDMQLANKGLTTALAQRAIKEYRCKFGQSS